MGKSIRSGALAIAGAVIALAGCAQTPMGPTVQVMPGPGKTFDTFQSDQSTCKVSAANQVQGQADQANKQAVGAAVLTTVLGAGLGAAAGGLGGDAGGGAALGAATGSTLGTGIGAQNSANAQYGIQGQYDNAFSQCMYSKGEQVPGFAPIASAAPSGSMSSSGPDPLVRSVQSELIRLDYLKDGADGMMGPRTSSAIRQFEHARGMPADGEPSPALLAKLQATPTSQAATASAPATWVAPAGSPPAAAPAAATAPAAPANWVAPATPQ
jgi:hypothetical protein